ncbi:MAG TPA: PIG-L family deacetylase [Terriglobales bacterium]|nr:PIG-L family deacetylase [Terriglobales bacterium]
MAAPITKQKAAIPSLQSIDALRGRTLVLVAHPDDELACAALLQRVQHPLVVIATDGAPQDAYFWSSYGTRHNYVAVRRQEAIESLKGVSPLTFLNDRTNTHHFSDQALHKNLIHAVWLLLETVGEFAPDAILTSAFEGGHPDHDSCSFLAALVGGTLCVPVWEMPLYHRDAKGQLVCQEFLQAVGNEAEISATDRELIGRERMLAVYRSQADLREFIRGPNELYRPQLAYNYSCPPHSGLLNYEVWRWPVSGAEVSLSMTNCHAYLQAACKYLHQTLTRPPRSGACVS